MTTSKKQRCFETVSDVIGVPVGTQTATPQVSPVVKMGPLKMPMHMRVSHWDVRKAKFGVVCYRAAHHLYVSILLDHSKGVCSTVYVAVMDKGKWPSKTNFTLTYETNAPNIKTVADYLEVFRESVVGLWAKAGDFDDDYIEIDMEDIGGLSDMDRSPNRAAH